MQLGAGGIRGHGRADRGTQHPDLCCQGREQRVGSFQDGKHARRKQRIKRGAGGQRQRIADIGFDLLNERSGLRCAQIGRYALAYRDGPGEIR